MFQTAVNLRDYFRYAGNKSRLAGWSFNSESDLTLVIETPGENLALV
jgi:hypothetical protein